MKRIASSFRPGGSCFSFGNSQIERYSLSLRENKWFHSHSTTAKVVEEDEQLGFRTLLLKRLQQAHRSVAVEVPSQKALLRASKFIEESADVKEIVHFTSRSKKEFIIAEFQDVGAAQRFLSTARSVVQNNEIPTFSRILRYLDTDYNKDSSKEVRSSKINVETLQNSDKTFANITEVVENVYEEEKLTELESSLRFLVCSLISDAFRGLFSHCEVLPFGSSVNGLGTHTSDLDAVLVFYGKKEHEDCGLFFQTKELKNVVRYEEKILETVGNVLNAFIAGVTRVDPVYRARVPLVKFYHEPFELNCDLTLSNVSGLEMSELLYNCGLLDSRVRPLAFAIKKWAKIANVTSDTATHTVSNFALFLLLVFFLQTRPVPVLPSLCQVAEIKSNKENNSKVAVNNLRSATHNQETLGDLLKEFFSFLRSFNFQKNGISPYHGKITKKYENNPLIIENPLDRTLNVSLNVTKSAFNNLIRAAGVAQNHLEDLSKSTEIRNSHFWKTLSSQQNAEARNKM